MNDAIATLKSGTIGIIAVGGGVTVSVVSQFEAWLRIASLVVGLVIGVVTLVRMLKSKPKGD